MAKDLFLLMAILALAMSSSSAVELKFEVQKTDTVTKYNLQLLSEKSVEIIWSEEVSLINGKEPYYWCTLAAWSQNERGMLVLVENNEFTGKLLQFDITNKFISQIDTSAKLLQHMRNGGSIKLYPLNKIVLTSDDLAPVEFVIRDGKLVNKSGDLYIESQTIQIGEPNSPTTFEPSARQPPTSKTSKPKSILTTPSYEPAFSPSWILIFIFILVASGLLWFLLKRRF